MIKILLIEDEREKRRVISEVITSVDGIDDECVDIATDVNAAKKAIKARRYDLVVLDINLPERQADLPAVGAGLEVLRFIKNNRKAQAPGYLVGMTAFDDGAAAAAKEFSSPIWKLVRFSHQDCEWMDPLREALKYLLASKRPPYPNDGATHHVELGIFVAIDEEAESILRLPGDWKTVAVPHDATRYWRGQFREAGRTISVVMVQAPRMGMPTAAVIATKLIHAFRPRYLAIAGICAGVKGKSEMGDILVADPCFDWGGGKWVGAAAPERNEKKFQPAAYQWRLDETLRAVVGGLSADEDLLSKIHEGFSGTKPRQPPAVIVDAMASGASVLQAAEVVADVRGLHKNLVGIEMESYAIFTAAELAAEPRPKCVSLKSVCDFGDESKGEADRAYAAFTSASFLYQLAVRGLAEEPA